MRSSWSGLITEYCASARTHTRTTNTFQMLLAQTVQLTWNLLCAWMNQRYEQNYDFCHSTAMNFCTEQLNLITVNDTWFVALLTKIIHFAMYDHEMPSIVRIPISA